MQPYPDVEINVVSASTVELRWPLHQRQLDLALVSTLNASDSTDVVRPEEAVPSDLHILNAPLPPLSSLGMLIAYGDTERSPAVEAFANHIRQVLPTL